ncbi:unnamed protein product [Heterobilharzia americana]|nr:unnamed protein product [Heterobilharzia americana]
MKLLDSPPIVEQSVNNRTPNRQDFQCVTSKNVIPIESQPTVSLTEKLISSFRTCGLKACSSTRSEFPNAYIKDLRKPLTLIYQAYLGIKYYPADPTIIADEQTRYQIFIQVRNDLINGRMQVDENLFVTLCGLILQSDCGDYGADRLGPNYVKQLLKLPNLNDQLEKRIKAKHEECRCRQPALVEYQLLDKVKQLPTYGQIKFHIKETISNTPGLLCLGPTGVIIEDSRRNLIQFSWPQITGFGHRNKQILIKILNEGTRFTYRCSVEDSETCENLLEICKNYLNFYRNEISQRIINEPHQLVINTTVCPSTSTVQPLYYVNSSLDTSGSAIVTNEPTLLSDSKYPVRLTESIQPVSSDYQPENVRVNRNIRPLYSSLIEFTPVGGNEMKPSYLLNPHVNHTTTTTTMCPTTVTTNQYHPYWFDVKMDNYDCQHNTIMPINPYHVRGTGMVFHRPRGCETVTDIGDRPHIYSNRRSHNGRWIINDTNEYRLKHRRKSFPKTKHYFIEENIDEHETLSDNINNEDYYHLHTSHSKSLVKSPRCQEFYHPDTKPISSSSFKVNQNNRHSQPSTSIIHRINMPEHRNPSRILPRPVSRLNRYTDRYSSSNTSQDTDDNDEIPHYHFNEPLTSVINENKTMNITQSSILDHLTKPEDISVRNYSLNSSRRQINEKNTNVCSPRSSLVNKSNVYHNSHELQMKSSNNQSISQRYNHDGRKSVHTIDNNPNTIRYYHDINGYVNEQEDDEEGEDSTNCRKDSDGEEGQEDYMETFNVNQYTPATRTISTTTSTTSTTATTTTTTTTSTTDTSFCSSSMYCPEESQTPSLLKNSDINSELCNESLCTSINDFKLPPTPNSPILNDHQGNATVSECNEEGSFDVNLPSPPSNDFLFQLKNCKLTNYNKQSNHTDNFEIRNPNLTLIENVSNDTGFCSHNENKHNRRLPLLPYERYIEKVSNSKQFIITPINNRKIIPTTIESIRINQLKMIPYLSPISSLKLSKSIGNHQRKSSIEHVQYVSKPEFISHHDQISGSDLV